MEREREREETDRRRGMRAEIQVPEQEGVEHRSEMVRPPLLCFERERERAIWELWAGMDENLRGKDDGTVTGATVRVECMYI